VARKKPTRRSEEAVATAIRGIFDVVATAIDRFGLPGAVFIGAYIFVERFGTLAQKREIIDLMIHPGEKGAANFLALLAMGVLVFFGQHKVWKKRLEAKDAEIKRLADWKTQHQQDRIPTRLHHAKSNDAGLSPTTTTPRPRRRTP
jgi:hypothetical protein